MFINFLTNHVYMCCSYWPRNKGTNSRCRTAHCLAYVMQSYPLTAPRLRAALLGPIPHNAGVTGLCRLGRNHVKELRGFCKLTSHTINAVTTHGHVLPDSPAQGLFQHSPHKPGGSVLFEPQMPALRAMTKPPKCRHVKTVSLFIIPFDSGRMLCQDHSV